MYQRSKVHSLNAWQFARKFNLHCWQLRPRPWGQKIHHWKITVHNSLFHEDLAQECVFYTDLSKFPISHLILSVLSTYKSRNFIVNSLPQIGIDNCRVKNFNFHTSKLSAMVRAMDGWLERDSPIIDDFKEAPILGQFAHWKNWMHTCNK